VRFERDHVGERGGHAAAVLRHMADLAADQPQAGAEHRHEGGGKGERHGKRIHARILADGAWENRRFSWSP